MRAEASFLPGFSAMGVRRRGSFPRSGSSPIYWPQPSRRDGRVAEGGGLLNRYRVEKLYRGFESLSLRQNCPPLPIPPSTAKPVSPQLLHVPRAVARADVAIRSTYSIRSAAERARSHSPILREIPLAIAESGRLP